MAADGHLEVIELDRDLVPGLRVKFFNQPGFVVHEGDALKFDFRALRGEVRRCAWWVTCPTTSPRR